MDHQSSDPQRGVRPIPVAPGPSRATYKYYNMDQVVAQALTLFARMNGTKRSTVLAASA